MGNVRHSAIVATAWQQAAVDALTQYAQSIGARPLVSSEVTNGYITVCIPPDGSQEGWEESDAGDVRRASIRQWIAEHPDFYFEWCEVAYGSDDCSATIVKSAWEQPR